MEGIYPSAKAERPQLPINSAIDEINSHLVIMRQRLSNMNNQLLHTMKVDYVETSSTGRDAPRPVEDLSTRANNALSEIDRINNQIEMLGNVLGI